MEPLLSRLLRELEDKSLAREKAGEEELSVAVAAMLRPAVAEMTGKLQTCSILRHL